ARAHRERGPPAVPSEAGRSADRAREARDGGRSSPRGAAVETRFTDGTLRSRRPARGKTRGQSRDGRVSRRAEGAWRRLSSAFQSRQASLAGGTPLGGGRSFPRGCRGEPVVRVGLSVSREGAARGGGAEGVGSGRVAVPRIESGPGRAAPGPLR